MEDSSVEEKLNYKAAYHEERQKRVWDSMFYGHQRIDVLIITLSSAGIYLCFETLKYLREENLLVSPLIKIAAIILLAVIILNLICQAISTRIQATDYSICDFCIQRDEDDIEECKSFILDKLKLIEKDEKILRVVSIIEYVLLTASLSILVIFFCVTF